LWLLGNRQQRIEPGCPWQNGRVERFIGTVKRELKHEVLTSSHEFDRSLTGIRQ
jgi:transposase InsO family protein